MPEQPQAEDVALLQPMREPQREDAVLLQPMRELPQRVERVEAAVAAVAVVAEAAAVVAMRRRQILPARLLKDRWRQRWRQRRPWDTCGRPKLPDTRCATP
jgi:hypothetical protein